VKPIEEQVILITGATDGLGRGLAAELAAAGATVLVHGRSEERGADVVRELGARSRFYRADLASLDEVRGLAEDVLAREPQLDVLVNNAGIGTTLPGDGARVESRDGYELRFAVNYLAGFALTRLLLPRLIASAPARIVNVSSAGQAPIDFDDVMLERHYSGVQAYCQSKLAQIMLTLDLAEELRDRDVTATALHPATYMPTKMVLHARGSAVSTLEEGVAATLRLVADPALDGVSGVYFNRTTEARAEAQAYDAEARRRLRRLSVRLAGVPD
jgi:NAD(P)-dependent dehydrogenase (short-subunit alcohol dehydrogenase family)